MAWSSRLCRLSKKRTMRRRPRAHLHQLLLHLPLLEAGAWRLQVEDPRGANKGNGWKPRNRTRKALASKASSGAIRVAMMPGASRLARLPPPPPVRRRQPLPPPISRQCSVSARRLLLPHLRSQAGAMPALGSRRCLVSRHRKASQCHHPNLLGHRPSPPLQMRFLL